MKANTRKIISQGVLLNFLSLLMRVGLTVAASATNAAIQKKMY